MVQSIAALPLLLVQYGDRELPCTGMHALESACALLQVRIKLKHMEIEIRRRETTGTGSSARNESETLAKYEIMDGAPVRGENIPIR